MMHYVETRNFDPRTGQPVRSECYDCGGPLEGPTVCTVPESKEKGICGACLRHPKQTGVSPLVKEFIAAQQRAWALYAGDLPAPDVVIE